MINKAGEEAHAHTHTHTETGVMPSITETINTTPGSISQPLSSAPHSCPPASSTYVHVWQLTSLPLSRDAFTAGATVPNIWESVWSKCARLGKKKKKKSLRIWIDDLLQGRRSFFFFFFFCSTLMAQIQLQVHSVALSNYLLPSGAINNGRQSASLRRGKCSHL